MSKTWNSFPPNKKTVRLDDVAQVYREEVSNLILRDNTMRKAMISCNPSPQFQPGRPCESLSGTIGPGNERHGLYRGL